MNDVTKFAVSIVDGPRGLSRRMAEHGVDITRQAIEQWECVPATRVQLVEQITGVSRYRLRPDIYGAQPSDDPVDDRIVSSA